MRNTMRKIVSKLYNSSPKEIFNFIKTQLESYSSIENKAEEISSTLQKLFEVYKTSNLKKVSPEKFSNSLKSKIGISNAQSEGYSKEELERQRDLSITFHWGHNHDFGDFKLDGKMKDRHIDLLANFIALFPITLNDFRNKRVFDIGCWTGGTTLLLATLAKNVVAIEEVKKYSETASYLVKSFGIEDKVSIKPLSIYNCNLDEFYNTFDIVYFPGVIYHLSDPLLALRILFNSLKAGGCILIESAGINRDEPFCLFEGSLIYSEGTKEKQNRGGWNWFKPTPSALYRMMREAGFDEIQTKWHFKTNRVYGYGKKISQVGICKAGLSVPNIK